MKNSLTSAAFFIASLLILALSGCGISPPDRGASAPSTKPDPGSYTLVEPAEVSLAVYDSEGRMVRELQRAVPMETGTHKVVWDGLDKEGQPVSPGEYTWKMLSSQGLETEYVMSLGTSVGHSHWPGVHGGPSAVTVHGDTMYMAGAGSEAAMGIAAADLDGTFAWSEHSLAGWGGALDAAVVGERIWFLYADYGRTLAAALKDGENLKTSIEHQISVRAIDLTTEAPEMFSTEKGYGWESTDSVGVVESEEGGHIFRVQDTKENAEFIIDLPPARSYARQTHYTIRLLMKSGPTADGTPMKIGIQQGGKWTATFDPASGKTDLPVVKASPVDGKLKLTFYSADKQTPLAFILRGIHVSAHVNRMDASEDQMIVAAAGSNGLLWVDPDREPTADLPESIELTLPENERGFLQHAWAHDGGPGGLQTPIPGSFTEHGYFIAQIGGNFDIGLNLSEKKPHRMALYFDQDRSEPHERSMQVQLLDPESNEVLDTRDVNEFEDGKYLIWNLNRDVTVRIRSTAIGGPILNGIFFDPVATPMPEAQSVQFLGTDTQTHGAWQGKHGKDGFYIPGLNDKLIDGAKVPNIQDVEILPDGSLVAISGSDLVTLSRTDKTPTVRVRNLESPDILAVDQNSGDILVFQAGDSQQLLRFDKNFNLLSTHGRYGGRREGRYIPEDFAGVADIASDHKGGFVVAEWMSAPRRVAHFNNQGELQHEWYGGQMFYYSPGIDPEDPTHVWLNSQFDWLFEMEVDYKKKTYKVVSTWNMKEQLDPVLFKGPSGFWIWTQPLTIDGERYLAYEGATALLLKPDYENGRLAPVAAASVAPAYHMGGKAQLEEAPDDHPWKRAMLKTWEAQTNSFNTRTLRQFGYVDRNGDLEMQPDEFLLDASQEFHRSDYGYGSYIDSNFTAWRWGYDHGAPLWYRLPKKETLENGLPVWSYADKETGPKVTGVRGMHLIPSNEDTVYLAEVHVGDGYGRWWHQTYWEGHGFGWPGTMINQNLLTHRTLDGEVIWTAGGHHSGFPGPKGRVDLAWRVAGKVGNVLGIGSQTRQPCEFFSTDGLYIGGVLDRIAEDGLPPRVYAWWRVDPEGGNSPDNVGTLRYDLGQSAKIARAPDGGILYFGSGRNNIPVFRINGFDQIEDQTGTLTVEHPAQAASGSGTGLTAEYFTNTELDGEPAAKRIDSDVWFGYAFKTGKDDKVGIPWPEPEITGKPFSVRWSGSLEPRFTEDTVIGFYDRDSGVRVWINDELVIDDWDDNGKKEHSEPIHMVAGQKLPIRIEWRQVKDKNPEAHLVWESLSQPIAHVEEKYLYSE